MKKSELRSLIREGIREELSSKQPKQIISEMATFYKIKGDPEKSKQVVKLLKGRVPAKSTAFEVLDALETTGEADLYLLKKAKEARVGKPLPIQAYNTQDLKAILENPAVEKYVEKGMSKNTDKGQSRGATADGKTPQSIEDFLKAQGL